MLPEISICSRHCWRPLLGPLLPVVAALCCCPLLLHPVVACCLLCPFQPNCCLQSQSAGDSVGDLCWVCSCPLTLPIVIAYCCCLLLLHAVVTVLAHLLPSISICRGLCWRRLPDPATTSQSSSLQQGGLLRPLGEPPRPQVRLSIMVTRHPSKHS